MSAGGVSRAGSDAALGRRAELALERLGDNPLKTDRKALRRASSSLRV